MRKNGQIVTYLGGEAVNWRGEMRPFTTKEKVRY